MKLPILFFFILLFSSCSSNKRVLNSAEFQCLNAIDSLNIYLNPPGVDLHYNINWDLIDINEFQDLTEMEKQVAGIGITDKENKYYKFSKIIDEVIEHCPNSIHIDSVTKIIGDPTKRNSSEIYYVFNFGHYCKCIDCPKELSDCVFIRMVYDEGKVRTIGKSY